MTNLQAKIKALATTTIFGLAGLLGWYLAPSSNLMAPLLLFYVTLLVNTYFSIELFCYIVPKENVSQQIWDALLFFIYIAAGIKIGEARLFSFLVMLLFIVATMKYTSLLGVIPYPKLLKLKILVDLAGTLMIVLTFTGITLGYTTQSIGAMSIIFLIANIFFLSIDPLYHKGHDA